MGSLLQDLVQSFRFADAVDIFIVAVLTYALLSWVRQRAARSIAVPLLAAVALYWFARWLDLYLTIIIFQYGFIVALFAFVLIFQQDLRRGFERLTSWRWKRAKTEVSTSEKVVNSLVESIAFLTDRKIGALLVLPGDEAIESHVRGGVLVDARFSFPLFCSIFNPESPGHDGAVTLVGGRIGELGLHLPLSTDFSQVPGGGTRHAAGLGLTERCDALAIIVSEERGTVSVAENGRLTEVSSEELLQKLRTHFEAQSPVGKKVRSARSRIRAAGRQVIAIVLATLIWFSFAYQTDSIQKTIVLPIEYRGVPERLTVDAFGLTHGQITLRGSDQAFRTLEPDKLAISLDLTNASIGEHVYETTAESVRNLPRELDVTDLQPRNIHVTIRGTPPREVAKPSATK